MKLNRRRFLESVAATPFLAAGLASLKASPRKIKASEIDRVDDSDLSVSISASHSPEREDSDGDD